MGALRPQSFYKFNIFIKPNVQMLTGRSGGVGTGVPPHLAALRPSETVGRPHCSVAPATGSSDSGSGGAVPSLCCFHLPTARQGERKALLGRGPEPWLLARGRPRARAGSPAAGKKHSGCRACVRAAAVSRSCSREDRCEGLLSPRSPPSAC